MTKGATGNPVTLSTPIVACTAVTAAEGLVVAPWSSTNDNVNVPEYATVSTVCCSLTLIVLGALTEIGAVVWRVVPLSKVSVKNPAVGVPAGYGKVAAVNQLRESLGMPGERVVYVGDGSSDIHVMLHVNRCDGLTIAASEARHIASIARRTVMSDDALSVLIPVLEDILGYDRPKVRALFEHHGVLIQEWDRVRTDWLTIRDGRRLAAGSRA